MDANKVIPTTIIAPVFAFLVLLNILVPGDSWLRTEITRLGAIPLTLILLVNIVMLLAGVLLIQQFNQMSREHKLMAINFTPIVSSLIILDLCIEYAIAFKTPSILLRLLLIPILGWLYFAGLDAFQKSLVSVPANTLMNVSSIFLGNRSIRGMIPSSGV